jgi:hypothetical protein
LNLEISERRRKHSEIEPATSYAAYCGNRPNLCRV